MLDIKVKQLHSRSGPVKNQFEIRTPEGRYFQSYDSIIAFRDTEGKIFLDEYYYDYSRTTSKYLYQWLGGSAKEGIASGRYTLTDLNSPENKKVDLLKAQVLRFPQHLSIKNLRVYAIIPDYMGAIKRFKVDQDLMKVVGALPDKLVAGRIVIRETETRAYAYFQLASVERAISFKKRGSNWIGQCIHKILEGTIYEPLSKELPDLRQILRDFNYYIERLV